MRKSKSVIFLWLPLDHGNGYLFGLPAATDGGYDNIDRSDENINDADRWDRTLNYTTLEYCTDYDVSYNPFRHGVMCNGLCLNVADWCQSYNSENCGDLRVNDPVLCSNYTFWQNITCTFLMVYDNMTLPTDITNPVNQHDNYGILYKGERCKGTLQHCYYPYYPYISSYFFPENPEVESYRSTCLDNSDRVFKNEQRCPDIPHELCRDGYGHVVPCPEQLCWESCAQPSLFCKACTNTTYFICPLSQQCVHPSLRCDGHPQCEYGEDEDLDVCGDTYRRNEVISKDATFRCKSIMYPIMETLATACNNFPECVDGEDEQFCSDNTVLYIFLYTTLGFIALTYLFLNFARNAYTYFTRRNQQVYSFRQNSDRKIEELCAEYHNEDNKNEEINSVLFHIILTKSKEEITSTCRAVYALEAVEHKNDKNEIYCCLYKNLDLSIMETILNIQFPSLFKKIMDYLENLAVVSKCLDYIKETKCIQIFFNTMLRLFKIEVQYLDILKDSLIAFSLYRVVGGYRAMMEFPSNFPTIVVLCFFSSVIIPIFFATLHLATHHPFIIFNIMPSETIKSGFKRTLMTIFCLLLSFLNPLLLINAYESAKEGREAMAKAMDARINCQMRNLKAIKHQWLTFIKIELGKILSKCILSQ